MASAPDSTSAATLRARKVRILFIAANPSDTTRLAILDEILEIHEALRASGAQERFDDLKLEPQVRIGGFANALQRHRPDVVHFSGHGSAAGELLLLNARGQAEPARPDAIAADFALLARDLRVRCVLLNACYSELLAEALSKHVDCVIGTSATLKDKDALAFANSFYASLGFGRDVETAHGLACNRIRREGAADQTLPRLHHRPGVDPSQVRLPQPAPYAARKPAAIVATVALVATVAGAALRRPAEAPIARNSASPVEPPSPAFRHGAAPTGPGDSRGTIAGPRDMPEGGVALVAADASTVTRDATARTTTVRPPRPRPQHTGSPLRDAIQGIYRTLPDAGR